MTTPQSLERLTEGIERAERHWAARHQGEAGGPGAATAFSVAVAREAGCPGTSVARELGARLGWPVYDHELLEHIAREMGLRVKLVESVDERHRSWIEEAIEGFSAAPGVSEEAYVRHLVETVLALGAHGGCVIVGRGAAHVLPAATTLRVRLVGPVEDRVWAVSQRVGLPREQAARYVEETDRARTRFVRDHFGKDPADPRGYDLVLNTARWPVADCVELILAALRRLEGRAGG